MNKRAILFIFLLLVTLPASCSRSGNTHPPATSDRSEATPSPRTPRKASPKSSPELNTLSATVIGITDGDTITVLDDKDTSYVVRLQGIDAPERRQAFGRVSHVHLARLLAGKQVTLEYQKTDRYDRIVAKVLVAGSDACLDQIKSGLAWHFKRYENEQSAEDRQLYNQAEQDARSGKLGLWQDANPTPPWDYRGKSEIKQ